MRNQQFRPPADWKTILTRAKKFLLRSKPPCLVPSLFVICQGLSQVRVPDYSFLGPVAIKVDSPLRNALDLVISPGPND